MSTSSKKKVAAKKKAVEKPIHPLMTDGWNWDRNKVIEHICDHLAISSRSVGSILNAGYEGEKLPNYSTIMKWLSEDETLFKQYSLAKEAQADYLAEELLEIADDGRNDWIEQLNGEGVPIGYKLNGEHVQRSRLRLDTRKWLASKLKPKKWGESQEIRHSGEVKTAPPVFVLNFSGPKKG